MIGYAIWDQTNLISNRFLRQYIKNSFYEIALHFDIQIDYDFERLVDTPKYNHLVVFQSGHTSPWPNELKIAIEEFCKRDFLVAGQIIYHVNTYPFLHPQMIILNMDHYRALGKPMIGYHEESEVLELQKPERSVENVHDDYTPLWLKSADEMTYCIRREFGWNIIHESLRCNIQVSNDIWKHKRFLYPMDRPHLFADCLEKLSRKELREIPEKLNQNQRDHLINLLSFP